MRKSSIANTVNDKQELLQTVHRFITNYFSLRNKRALQKPFLTRALTEVYSAQEKKGFKKQASNLHADQLLDASTYKRVGAGLSPSFQPNVLTELFGFFGDRSVLNKTPSLGTFRSETIGSVPKLSGYAFDDLMNDFKGKETLKQLEIADLRIFHDENAVFGVQVGYRVHEMIIYAPCHLGRNAREKCLITGIVLGKGEYITKIQGSYGEFIEKIEVRTNWARMIEAGSSKSVQFENLIPRNKRLISLGGFCRDYLNALYAYYE